MKHLSRFWTLLRFCLSWIFLWPFFDKLLGLGFSTKPEASWLNGGSPTTGFLKFGTKGPLAEIFHMLAGQQWVDWLFMIGLLLIGLSLLLGVGLRIASYAGAILLMLMWLATFPPLHNPFLDEHIIYALVLLVLPSVNAGHWFGLADKWSQTNLVKKYPFLQ